MIIYFTDGTEEGFFTAAFFACKDTESIVSSSNIQLPLGAEIVSVQTDPEKCDAVKKSLRAYDSRCLRELSLLLKRGSEEREQIALAYLRKIVRRRGPVREMLADPDVLAARENIRKVTAEAHHFTGFLRFMEGTGELFYAPFEPDNDILELILPHFLRRLPGQSFVIHDVKRQKAALYNGHDCVIAKTEKKVNILISDREEIFRSLWKEYYRSVNITQRPHEKQMKGYMPVRYWKYMPEKTP